MIFLTNIEKNQHCFVPFKKKGKQKGDVGGKKKKNLDTPLIMTGVKLLV